MSPQRIVQLLVSFLALTVVALLSERSHTLAAITAVMPLKVTVALLFVFSDTGGDGALSADFCRTAALATIPTAMFLGACWVGLRQGWSLGRVVVMGYAVWLAAIGAYRGVEWWVRGG